MIGPDTSEWFAKICKRLFSANPVKVTTTGTSGSVPKEAVTQDQAKMQSLEKHTIKISLFKIAIVFIGIIFMAIYYYQSKNRRYSIVDKNHYAIIDNRTGILYFGDDTEKPVETTIILDQVNGTIRYVPLKKLP